MKYQLGDTVLLLHSNEEGEIVEFINKDMVLIDIDGIRFPVYLDQIDFPYFKRFTEKKAFMPKKEKLYVDQIRKEKIEDKYRVHNGIWLSFIPVYNKDVPEEDEVKSFKIYLLNQTPDTLSFDYAVKLSGRQEFHHKNDLFPFSDFYVHDIDFDLMNDAPRFEFTFRLNPPLKNKAEQAEASFKIKAKQLFKKLEEMHMKNEPGFSFLLLEAYPDKTETLAPEYVAKPDNLYNINNMRQKLAPARSVVDLHIEKLVDDYRNLSNFEILTIQLREFEKYYHLAVAHKQPNLVVIHGVGTGKLRTEIHEILKLKQEVKSFANQYHPNFGFGATEIFFQY